MSVAVLIRLDLGDVAWN